MAHALGDLSPAKLEKFVSTIWKDFEGRDKKWGDRRRVRYRQLDRELEALPLSKRAGGNKALMIFQTEEPNQEVHRRVKRLVANKIRIEVVIYDDDEDAKRAAQDMKDALKALYKWMNRGKIPAERKVVEYQQADGLGIFKLELVSDFADDALQWYDPEVLEVEVDTESPADEAPEQTKARDAYNAAKSAILAADPTDTEAAAKAYKQVTDKARRKCDPPFVLVAPDPLTCVYTKDHGVVDTIVEKGKRKVNALLEAYESHRLRLLDNRLIVWPEMSSAVGDDTIPTSDTLAGEYSDTVEYIEIRTRDEIIMLIEQPRYQNGRAQSRLPSEDKYIKIVYENPFGPYSTGYVLCPGDITGSHDPADEFQPSILGSLAVAQPLAVLGTIRLSAAIDNALAPKYIKVEDAAPPPALSQELANKTPTVKDGDPVAQIPGEVKRAEVPNVDLDKAEAQFNALMGLYRFNEVLAGDAESDSSGHKLAIQVSQADTQLVPYQNTRAEATAEILECCLYASKKLGVPIAVKETPDRDAVLMNKVDTVQPVRMITPDMFDLDATLIVTIGSETPVTKFAKWSALEARYKAGTLSYETLMEQSDVENVADEIARVFEGQTLVAVMQQAIPVIVQMIAAKTVSKIAGPPGETVGQGGNENGGGMPGAEASTPIAGMGRMPGVGMSPAGPPEQQITGGTQPGGAELAPIGAP